MDNKVYYKKKPRKPRSESNDKKDKIIDPFELWDEMFEKRKEKKVKWVESFCPFERDVRIIDLSLSGKGMDEDKMYALNKEWRNKIRRGNTLIEIPSNDPNNPHVYWGRKGFRKFFDIHTEYLDFNLGDHTALKRIHFRTYAEHKNLSGIIFDEAKRMIDSGESV